MPKVRQVEYENYSKKMAARGVVGSNVNPNQIPYLGKLEDPFEMIPNPHWKDEITPPPQEQPIEGNNEL